MHFIFIFNILIKDRPIEKITVEEVISKAGVGRATYFRAFNSKQEAITFKLVRMWDQYCELNDIKVRKKFELGNADAFFLFCYSIKHILNIIYTAGLQETVYRAFYEVMLDRPTELRSEEYYREKFYLHGLSRLQDGWIKRSFKESPEEMSLILNQIITTPHAKTQDQAERPLKAIT